jgi:hypothetical protein
MGTGTINKATTYWLWLYQKNSTGSNDGILDIYLSTTSTRPGSPTVHFTTGDGTTAITSVVFYKEQNSIIIDDFRYNVGNVAIN